MVLRFQIFAVWLACWCVGCGAQVEPPLEWDYCIEGVEWPSGSELDMSRQGRPAIGPLVDLGGVAGSRQRASLTRLGNEFVLDAPNPAQYEFWSEAGLSEFPLLGSKQLLNVGPNDVDESELGAAGWTLLLQSTIEEQTDGEIDYAPLVAVVQYGAGATTQTFLVDATSAVVTIPSPYVRVNVGYTQFGSYDNTSLAYPTKMRVSGALNRSSQTGKSATLTRLIAPENDTTINVVKVPPFAVGWSLSNSDSPADTNPSGLDAAIVFVGELQVDYADDVILDSMKRTLCFRPLPTNASQMNFQNSNDSLKFVTFKIALGS